MNTEPTTMDVDIQSRQVIADWTSSLLRLRSRPTRMPPRGEWRFASVPARGSKDGYRAPAVLRN